MRRTEQEFKAEVLRRSEQYRAERKKRRKKFLNTTLCCLLVFCGIFFMRPLFLAGGGSTESAAVDMVAEQIETNEMGYRAEEAAPMEDKSAAVCAGEIPEVEPSAVKIACGIEEITLDAADSAIIMDYLSSGEWSPTAANCICDYTLYVNGLTYHYHSDCGTIQDEYGQSLNLSEADKQIFNDIMGRCPRRIN